MKEEEMDGNEQSGQEKKKVQMCFFKKEQIKNGFRTKYSTWFCQGARDHVEQLVLVANFQ